MALLCDGTLVVNLREFFAAPLPDLLEIAPKIRGSIFIGVAATSQEARDAIVRLQHGHREAAAYLIGGRKTPLLKR